jgi:hypothetical protein
VPDLAHRDAPAGQLLARGDDVRDDGVEPADGDGRGVEDPDADGDGARRAGRRQPDDAEVVARAVVDVEREAGLLGGERLGAVRGGLTGNVCSCRTYVPMNEGLTELVRERRRRCRRRSGK